MSKAIENNYKYRLLDLFCGEGGCSAGYAATNRFSVFGVDRDPKRLLRYPYWAHCGDALDYARRHWMEYDAIHASPPCQAYSASTAAHRSAGKQYDDYLLETQSVLQATGLPYVIENVEGCTLLCDPVMLCGTMFGLKVYRHRLFECSFPVYPLKHWDHVAAVAPRSRLPKDGEYMGVTGHVNTVHASRHMQIHWMSQRGLSQAIPAQYTKYIGNWLVEWLNGKTVDCTNKQ